MSQIKSPKNHSNQTEDQARAYVERLEDCAERWNVSNENLITSLPGIILGAVLIGSLVGDQSFTLLGLLLCLSCILNLSIVYSSNLIAEIRDQRMADMIDDKEYAKIEALYPKERRRYNRRRVIRAALFYLTIALSAVYIYSLAFPRVPEVS